MLSITWNKLGLQLSSVFPLFLSDRPSLAVPFQRRGFLRARVGAGNLSSPFLTSWETLLNTGSATSGGSPWPFLLGWSSPGGHQFWLGPEVSRDGGTFWGARGSLLVASSEPQAWEHLCVKGGPSERTVSLPARGRGSGLPCVLIALLAPQTPGHCWCWVVQQCALQWRRQTFQMFSPLLEC